jgi:transcriptional regulator with AAA-type ATPase domain
MPSPRLSGARFDQLLQQAREAAFWLSGELKFLWVNRAWEELTGYPAAEALGLACRAHGPSRGGDLSGVGGSFYPPPEALGGRPAAARTLIIHPSGERRWRRVEYWPFHNEMGVLTALLGLVRDPDEAPLAPESDAHHLRAELMEVRDRLLGRFGLDSLVGRGPAHRRLLDQVSAAAASTVPVLIAGEPGTGKRLAARAIHHLGARREAPLVPVDCAALPPEVLERALFGTTGAGRDGDASSRLALPEGATLLIGDVLDLPRDLQARLASALDGPVRLIATTTDDPDASLRSERLRPDLYYALTTLVIPLNPLRERLDELPVLAQHLLERANARGGRQRSGFSPEALKALLAYDWPGNVRELARVIDDAQGRGEGDAIEAADLPAAVRGHLASAYVPPPVPPPVTPLDELLTQVERRLIESALQRARRNKSKAAELLGISRPRLYRRIKELGFPDEPEPGDEPPASPPAEPRE